MRTLFNNEWWYFHSILLMGRIRRITLDFCLENMNVNGITLPTIIAVVVWQTKSLKGFIAIIICMELK